MEKEVTKTKKREKIVIYNTDGTTEEYKTGILFTLDEINFKGDGEIKFIGKHCNTKKFMNVYIYSNITYHQNLFLFLLIYLYQFYD